MEHCRFGYQVILIQVSNVLLHPLSFLLATLNSVNTEFKYHSAMRVPFYKHPMLVTLAKFSGNLVISPDYKTWCPEKDISQK